MISAILFSRGLEEYDFGEGHPFRGIRFVLFAEALKKYLPQNHIYTLLDAPPATDNDLFLIHHENYIEFTRGYYETSNLGIAYPGRFNDFHSMDNLPTGHPGKIEEAARLVVGQAKKACNLVQQGEYNKVVSIGGGLHHAKSTYGEGFCLYNDVAFCAKYLQREYKLDRIVIIDTDAHVGNGTMDYFYEDSRVLYIDIHQHPRSLYPHTGFPQQIGAGDGIGFTVNIPLPERASDEAYRLAFESVVEPIIQEFKPQIIIRNGGSDPHYEDGLTDLGLTIDGFTMIAEKIRRLSGICNGKQIDLIASGYNMDILPPIWIAMIAGLLDVHIAIEEPGKKRSGIHVDAVMEETGEIIREIKDNLKEYWNCFK